VRCMPVTAATTLRVLTTDIPEHAHPGQKPAWMIEGRTLLSDRSPVTIKYVGRIADPRLWDSLFTVALKYRLAALVAYALTGNRTLAEQMWSRYAVTLKEARAVDGQETAMVRASTRSLTEIR
jgi:hypothetical protein